MKYTVNVGFILWMVFISGMQGLYCQDSGIDEMLTRYGETYLKVKIRELRDIALLDSFTSLADIRDDSAVVNVNREEFARLQDLGFTYRHIPLPRSSTTDMMGSCQYSENNWDYYPTWPQYDSIMTAFGQQYPGLCQTIHFFTLASGRKLLAVKLTSSVNPPGSKPLFLYSSTMHGDETTGYILMLRLTDHLLQGYGTDPEATWLLDNMEIWICPLANPDGTYHGGNHTVSGAIRRNANNVDLNRNYRDPRVGHNPDGLSYQPETVAFMELADTLLFVMGGNLHGGAEVVNYPWDTWTKLHPDNNWWMAVSRAYADTVHAHSPSGFFNDLDNGITNGAAWYVITGGRQDYMNYFAHCKEVTLEVSNTMLMPANQLNSMWDYHHRSLINYIKEGWYGLRGMVTDSTTGLPLKARIWIDGHDADSSHVWSQAANGYYFRPAFPGTWTITCSAPGYHSKSAQITIVPKDTTNQDIALVPIGFGTEYPSSSGIHIWYAAQSNLLHVFQGKPETITVTVFASDGRMVLDQINPNNPIPVHLRPGMYTFRLVRADGFAFSRKIVVY